MGAYKVAGYGWVRDTPDHRDRIFNLEERVERGYKLPATFSVQSEMPDVFNQLQVGSCTANADVGVVEHAAIKVSGDTVPLSRMGLYADERLAEGQSPPLQDSGAQVRTGIKLAVSHGIGPESSFPYDESKVGQVPPQEYYDQARVHRALTYKRIMVGPGAPLRSALYQGYPFAFGFSVPDYFEDENWNPAQEPLRLPTPDANIIGGHAVVAVAYDTTLQRFPEPVFKIRNSWGKDWGEKGHFYMPFSWFTSSEGLAGDMWAVMTAE